MVKQKTKKSDSLELPKRKTKKKFILPLLGVAVVVIASIAFLSRSTDINYDFIVAEKSLLTQEVNVTGKVKAAESVDLSFENGGKVAAIYVEVGQAVNAGDILVQLDSSELRASVAASAADLSSERAGLARYQAILEQEEAVLAELKSGTRPEEIQIAETEVENAEKSLEDEIENLESVQNKADTDLESDYDDVQNTLSDALTKAENVMQSQIDDFFTSSGSQENLSFGVESSSIESGAKWAKDDADQALEDLSDAAARINTNSSQDEKDEALSTALDALFTINDLLVLLDDALEDSQGLSTTTLSSYKSDLNSARTSIDTAINTVNSNIQNISTQKASNQSSISTAEAKVSTAENVLLSAEDNLRLKQAGSTPERINAQEAIVKQAKANISSQNAQISRASARVALDQAKLNKATLYSPIGGVVTLQDAKVGEIISSNELAVSIISEALFQVEANVPEVDIANIQVGNMASLTLDAHGRNTPFSAKVIKIDPAETIIEGVSTYKVTLEFTEEDSRIKSGMTANIDIFTAEQEDVISVQKRAIIKKEDGEYLRVIREEEIIEVPVKTGLTGKDGYVEILEGLEEGDSVVTYINEE